jgi:hypothetical protein
MVLWERKAFRGTGLGLGSEGAKVNRKNSLMLHGNDRAFSGSFALCGLWMTDLSDLEVERARAAQTHALQLDKQQ